MAARGPVGRAEGQDWDEIADVVEVGQEALVHADDVFFVAVFE